MDKSQVSAQFSALALPKLSDVAASVVEKGQYNGTTDQMAQLASLELNSLYRSTKEKIVDLNADLKEAEKASCKSKSSMNCEKIEKLQRERRAMVAEIKQSLTQEKISNAGNIARIKNTTMTDVHSVLVAGSGYTNMNAYQAVAFYTIRSIELDSIKAEDNAAVKRIEEKIKELTQEDPEKVAEVNALKGKVARATNYLVVLETLASHDGITLESDEVADFNPNN